MIHKIICNSNFSVCKLSLTGTQPCSFIYGSIINACFPAAAAEVSSCNRRHSPQSLKYLLSGPLQKQIADP